MRNKAVILDRDGTINIEKNYLYKIEDFEFEYKAPEAIKLLNNNGYKVIVITNQAGVGRGYYTEEDVNKLHQYINKELKKYEAWIDAFYYCPHHPENGIGKYKVKCNCRKPGNQLFLRAIKDFNIDTEKSYVIGDKLSDLIPGRNIGMKTILVGTGYGKGKEYDNYFIDIKKLNLFDAILEIVSVKKIELK